MEHQPYIEAKVVLLGDTGVGKTSTVLRYVEQRFLTSSTPTIGASFLSKTIWVSGSRVKLQLWDTAGQERFRSLAPMYYRGAAAAVLVYDVTSADTFTKVKEWVKELRTNVFDDLILIICGNQIDRTARNVDSQEAAEYAKSIGALFFETSAKNNIGIEEMFFEIAKQLVGIKHPSQNYGSISELKPVQHQEQRPCCV